ISPCFTRAEALAISTAREAVCSTEFRERSSDDAKPHAPSAITLTPTPNDSESAALPILPFLVASERLRSSTMRASAYEAPFREATVRAQEAISCMAEIQCITALHCPS